MATIDMNLLAALDVLLAERGVTAAARKLGLSPSAMSRTLARLRTATGDPLLVQAGRSLVPTPYAEHLASRVHTLAEEVRAVLAPVVGQVDQAVLNRTFTIRANEGFVALFAPAIVAGMNERAPGVRLRFAPKPDKNATPLRDGTVDLEIGTTAPNAPELRSQLMFRDRFVGVARTDHPLFTAPITPQAYANSHHVVASRRGIWKGPVDAVLEDLGLERDVVAIVPSFFDAMSISSGSDLVALVPYSCLRGRDAVTQGLQIFNLPVATPDLTINAIWHPRLDADPGHRWFRQEMITICRAEI